MSNKLKKQAFRDFMYRNPIDSKTIMLGVADTEMTTKELRFALRWYSRKASR